MNNADYSGHIWNEAIFADRNKGYGAYELRETYDARIGQSFLYCLSLIILFIVIPLIIVSYLEKVVNSPIGKPIIFEPISYNKEPDIKPQQQQKKESSNKKNSDNSAYVNRRDTSQMPVDTIPVLTANNTTCADTSASVSPEPAGPSGGGFLIPAPEVHNTWQVDILPEFPGGAKALYEFMRRNAEYPAMAREEGKEGTVYVSFVVNADGLVVNAKVLHRVGYGLDEAALHALSKMPKWTPGMSHGTAVSTVMQLPIKFVTIK